MMNEIILSREQVRRVDQLAVEAYHMPSIVLMENAGRGAAEVLLSAGARGPIVIVCGRGNNGGDGFVVARHLENRGLPVHVVLLADPQRLSGDALTNFQILDAAGTSCRVLAENVTRDALAAELHGAEWICDGLLGTGTTGAAREPYATAIRAINAAGAKVLALDLPSGIDCDTGTAAGECIRADLTATFVAAKPGFAAGASLVGELHVVDIGVPRGIIRRILDEKP